MLMSSSKLLETIEQQSSHRELIDCCNICLSEEQEKLRTCSKCSTVLCETCEEEVFKISTPDSCYYCKKIYCKTTTLVSYNPGAARNSRGEKTKLAEEEFFEGDTKNNPSQDYFSFELEEEENTVHLIGGVQKNAKSDGKEAVLNKKRKARKSLERDLQTGAVKKIRKKNINGQEKDYSRDEKEGKGKDIVLAKKPRRKRKKKKVTARGDGESSQLSECKKKKNKKDKGSGMEQAGSPAEDAAAGNRKEKVEDMNSAAAGIIMKMRKTGKKDKEKLEIYQGENEVEQEKEIDGNQRMNSTDVFEGTTVQTFIEGSKAEGDQQQKEEHIFPEVECLRQVSDVSQDNRIDSSATETREDKLTGIIKEPFIQCSRDQIRNKESEMEIVESSAVVGDVEEEQVRNDAEEVDGSKEISVLSLEKAVDSAMTLLKEAEKEEINKLVELKQVGHQIQETIVQEEEQEWCESDSIGANKTEEEYLQEDTESLEDQLERKEFFDELIKERVEVDPKNQEKKEEEILGDASIENNHSERTDSEEGNEEEQVEGESKGDHEEGEKIISIPRLSQEQEDNGVKVEESGQDKVIQVVTGGSGDQDSEVSHSSVTSKKQYAPKKTKSISKATIQKMKKKKKKAVSSKKTASIQNQTNKQAVSHKKGALVKNQSHPPPPSPLKKQQYPPLVKKAVQKEVAKVNTMNKNQNKSEKSKFTKKAALVKSAGSQLTAQPPTRRKSLRNKTQKQIKG